MAAEKRRRLLGGLAKCDDDLQTLRRIIAAVRAAEMRSAASDVPAAPPARDVCEGATKWTNGRDEASPQPPQQQKPQAEGAQYPSPDSVLDAIVPVVAAARVVPVGLWPPARARRAQPPRMLDAPITAASKASTASCPPEVVGSASALDLHAATLLSSGKKRRGRWTLRRGRYRRRRQRRAGEAPAILGEELAEESSGERRIVAFRA
ncbi:hypothetical protein ACQ4PT_027359 [Festuca glaucescens]